MDLWELWLVADGGEWRERCWDPIPSCYFLVVDIRTGTLCTQTHRRTDEKRKEGCTLEGGNNRCCLASMGGYYPRMKAVHIQYEGYYYYYYYYYYFSVGVVVVVVLVLW